MAVRSAGRDVLPLPPAPTAGHYLTSRDLAVMLGRSSAWVRRTVPGKITLGHRTVLWRERDVLHWIATCANPDV